MRQPDGALFGEKLAEKMRDAAGRSDKAGWHGTMKPGGLLRERTGREGRHNTARDIATTGLDCESATDTLLKHSSKKVGTAGMPIHGGPLGTTRSAR